MSKDEDQSLGDQHTFDGGAKDTGPESLGDEKTFSGGARQTAPQSLGDEITMGGGGSTDDTLFDDDMEVVDLSARYTTEGVLGKGGMGEVLLATDTRLERKVAIKRMLGDGARSRTAVSRFLTEAKSIAALNHPNIVQIYDYGRDKDGPFLIMEFVEGNSLLDRCQQGALPLEEAVELTCQLCDGLGKAHEANIIHRDIKPANVLLTNDGIPKLTDFGLAKDEAADTGLSVAGAVLGTLDFMPPEQRKDSALTDNRSDLWSLAATLYQMVTGKSPKIIRFDNVPQSLQDVLGKALEEAKDDRYQTAREFGDALRASLRDSGPDVSDLGEGECPHCGTKNESSRKFCRNCAESLESPCLSCSAGMPMWEEVCGSCGNKQADLLEARRTEMSSQQSEAERLLKSYDFKGARKLAVTLRDEPDLRLRQLKGWGEQFLQDVETGRNQQLERMGTQLSEALQHETAYDYASGLHTLDQVPEILREESVASQSLTVSALLSRLQKKQDESQRLDRLIRQRVKSRQLTGLLSKVESLLKLHPDRADIVKLKAQLIERDRKLKETRDTAYAEGKRLFEALDYEGCLSELAKIDTSVLLEEIAGLRDQAETKRDRLKTLRQSISEGVKEKKLHGLLSKVDECLSLQSDDAEMQNLRERLQKREEKNAAQVADVVEKARGLREQCGFEAASKRLQRIPQELVTQEVIGLLDECDTLGSLRKKALEALERAMESEKYKKGLTETKEYRAALDVAGLGDEQFQSQYRSCKESLEEQREAEEAADRQRALTKKLAIAGAAVTAVVLLIGAGLWMRSSMRASAIADALQQQKWDEVLALDTTNVAALIGRANQRLSAGTPDIDGAFEDLDVAERVDSSAEGLQAAKGLAYAKRAMAKAKADQTSDAVKALKEAETLGATALSTAVVKRLLVVAYVKRAEKAGSREDAVGVFAACDAAERLVSAEAESMTKEYQGLVDVKAKWLRATAWQGLAKTREQSGDLTGAITAYEEVSKLGDPDILARQAKTSQYNDLLSSRGAELAAVSSDSVAENVSSSETPPLEIATSVPTDHAPLETPPEKIGTLGSNPTARSIFPGFTSAKTQSDLERSASQDKLKILMLASHNYHDVHRKFPQSAILGSDGVTPHSWRVALLPYLGESTLYKQYNLDQPWDGPDNIQLVKKMPSVFRHPAAPAKSTNSSYFGFVGPNTAFGDNSTKIRLEDIEDGPANTIFIIEAKLNIPWTKPEDIPVSTEMGAGYDSNGVSYCTVDGQTHFTHNSGLSGLLPLITRNGGESIMTAGSDPSPPEPRSRLIPTGNIGFNPNALNPDPETQHTTNATNKTTVSKTPVSSSPGSNLSRNKPDREADRRSGIMSSERASLYAKLGQEALAGNDLSKASEHLSAAVKLDRSATGVVELATGLAEPAVVSFEKDASEANREVALTRLKEAAAFDSESEELARLQTRVVAVLGRPVAAFEKDASDANRDSALAAISRIESFDKSISEVPDLKAQVADLLLTRAAANAKAATLDSALADYNQGLVLGGEPKLASVTKTALVKGLRARFLAAVSNKDIESAIIDFNNIATLNPYDPADELIAELAKIPAAEFAKLPRAVLLNLPGDVLAKLPAERNSIGMQFRLLPSGTFTMGSDSGDSGDETPHKVTLTKPFYLGVYEVTQQQYEQVMGKNPSIIKGVQDPVEQVSWDDAVEFCRKLSALPAEKSAGYVYRLPTEAEWEYACRAGTTTKYSFGDAESQLGEYGWFNRIRYSSTTTHPVGQKKPNPWGLYDLHGNVWEWCADWYGDYPRGSVTDPTGPSSGSDRVSRGGSCYGGSDDCRSASRFRLAPVDRYPSIGFRVLRSSVK